MFMEILKHYKKATVQFETVKGSLFVEIKAPSEPPLENWGWVDYRFTLL